VLLLQTAKQVPVFFTALKDSGREWMSGIPNVATELDGGPHEADTQTVGTACHLQRTMPYDGVVAPGLKVMFCITSMPVGGAETLLVNLIDRIDRSRLVPELCCLKELGPLGEQIAGRIPAFSGLLSHKLDLRVWPRLTRLFRRRRIAAVVTVGAGDKMFWGRLAARQAGVPVVISALHSTGWPDSVGRLNRLLTPWTDAFVAVAQGHAAHLRDTLQFPADRVHVIPNGVDAQRFAPRRDMRAVRAVRAELGVDTAAPLVGIVAALRPEKNHALLIRAIGHLLRRIPRTRLVVVGDGPERQSLEKLTAELGIGHAVRFLGNRYDAERLLPSFDAFALSSYMEASPVSILEAMACGLPVVATRVGSVSESVIDGETGFLVESGATAAMAECLARILGDRDLARSLGRAGRQRVVRHGSLDAMVDGYQGLIEGLYRTTRQRFR